MAFERDKIPCTMGQRHTLYLADEDDMASDSANAICTQQSIKAHTAFSSRENEITAAGAATFDPDDYGCLVLNHTSQITVTIAAPVPGKMLVIWQKDAGTAGHTVTLTAGTWDGTNDVATLDAQDECLIVIGVSATRYMIVENIGSIAFS